MHIPSFEETLKNSYSHGLENIYSLETVDPKTIRRLNSYKPEPLTPLPSIANVKLSENYPQQIELDFGPRFRNWMPPFILNEPLQSLGLTPLLEKALLKNNFILIKDLLKSTPHELAFKGIGQGHIDEMNSKLKNYLAQGELKRCTRIDFVSLLKVVIGALDRRKIYVVLEPYRLQNLFTLMPVEAVEVKKLKSEEKELLRDEVSKMEIPLLQEYFHEIQQVFLSPWIVDRQGVADREEIRERLERVSLQPELTKPILQFFADTFGLSFPGDDCIEVELDLFTPDRYTAAHFREVIARSRSYFYHSQIIYPLDDLTQFLKREFTLSWDMMSEDFIRKVLLTSKEYYSLKHRGKLSIAK